MKLVAITVMFLIGGVLVAFSGNYTSDSRNAVPAPESLPSALLTLVSRPPGGHCTASTEPPPTPMDRLPDSTQYHADVFRFVDVCLHINRTVFATHFLSPPTNTTSREYFIKDEVAGTDLLDVRRTVASCSLFSNESHCTTQTPLSMGRLTRYAHDKNLSWLKLSPVSSRNPRTFVYPVGVDWGGANHGHCLIRMSSILKAMLARGLDPDYDVVVLWVNGIRIDSALAAHRIFAPITFKNVVIVSKAGLEVPVVHEHQPAALDVAWRYIDPTEVMAARCNRTIQQLKLHAEPLATRQPQAFCFRGWAEVGHAYVSLFHTKEVDYFHMITKRLRPKFGFPPIPGPAPTGVCTRRVATIVEREKNRMWFPADLAKLKAALTTASSELQREHNCSAPVFEVRSVLITAALPLDQQVKVFDESSYIIGMYGAGMYWMIFARANITIDMVSTVAVSDYTRASMASGNVINWLISTGEVKDGYWNVTDALTRQAVTNMKKQVRR